MSDTVRKFALERLENDAKYKQILSGVSDELLKNHIDLTVKEFVSQFMGKIDELADKLSDDKLKIALSKLGEKDVNK